ncbi:uncharacterized protein LOC110699072 [Chenopodium quinoa]|uniref:uncharacterized protein LOC110699072 n=1 Tax=Chenopodium quinoa TaxID=63459 RepID=UPI000B76C019|nr:uncharacterized protein LOC110699072 [Chenopodium quinoa]
MSWPKCRLAQGYAGKAQRLAFGEGLDALDEAHPLMSQHENLVTHIFPKVDFVGMMGIEQTCKRWRMWWRLRHLHFHYPFYGHRAQIQEWVLRDLMYNNGRDLHTWLNKDMTVYFDGFPLLYGDEMTLGRRGLDAADLGFF